MLILKSTLRSGSALANSHQTVLWLYWRRATAIAVAAAFLLAIASCGGEEANSAADDDNGLSGEERRETREAERERTEPPRDNRLIGRKTRTVRWLRRLLRLALVESIASRHRMQPNRRLRVAQHRRLNPKASSRAICSGARPSISTRRATRFPLW